MLHWSLIIVTANILADITLADSRNTSTLECVSADKNATGRSGLSLCRPKPSTEARRHGEQQSYSMLIQAAYGLTAITVLVVAYFVFRTMRFVQLPGVYNRQPKM